MKAYGSFDRLYNWVPYELSRGSFGGDFWTVRYRALDTLDVFSLKRDQYSWKESLAVWGLRINAFRISIASLPGLKPFSTDLINAGVEYQLTSSTVVRANFVRNDLVRAIEDMGVS